LPVFLPPAEEASGPRVPSWFAQPDVPPAVIAGRVVREGQGVAGVEVTLESRASAADPSLRHTKVSAADGGFSFGRQAPGPYEVIAAPAQNEPVHLRIDLRDPRTSPRPDRLILTLSPCRAVISGLVIDRDSGVPLPGARVVVLPADDPRCPAGPAGVTGSSGEYELCVSPGALRLRVEAAGHAIASLLLSEEELERRDVQLLPEVQLRGTTIDGATGTPLADVQVTAWPLDDEAPAAGPSATLSDAQGRFVLRGLRPHAHYRLDAWRSDYVGEDPMSVDTGADPSREVVRRLAAASRVAGVIQLQGRALVGARIRADRPPYAQSFVSVSQADGRFTLHGVPRGNDTLVVDGFRVLSPPRVEVGADERRDLTVEVEPRRR
jgi:hypothetical protein